MKRDKGLLIFEDGNDDDALDKYLRKKRFNIDIESSRMKLFHSALTFHNHIMPKPEFVADISLRIVGPINSEEATYLKLHLADSGGIFNMRLIDLEELILLVKIAEYHTCIHAAEALYNLTITNAFANSKVWSTISNYLTSLIYVQTSGNQWILLKLVAPDVHNEITRFVNFLSDGTRRVKVRKNYDCFQWLLDFVLGIDGRCVQEVWRSDKKLRPDGLEEFFDDFFPFLDEIRTDHFRNKLLIRIDRMNSDFSEIIEYNKPTGFCQLHKEISQEYWR